MKLSQVLATKSKLFDLRTEPTKSLPDFLSFRDRFSQTPFYGRT